MTKLEDTIYEELLSLEATAELTLQRIQKLKSKINGKPKVDKNRPLSPEHIAQVLSKRIKTRLKK